MHNLIKSRGTKWIGLALLVLVALTLQACGNKNVKTTTGSQKIKVVSTTGMIGDVVANIGGDRIQQRVLMGPGVDPHLYRASEGDVQRLNDAQVIFYNGLHLEAKLGDILKNMSRTKPTIAVTKKISKSQLLTPPDFDGYPDPHVWFSVPLWETTINTIRDALIKADPSGKSEYQANAKSYKNQLKTLNKWVGAKIKTLPQKQRILVTAHDAFNYFGEAYKFQVVGLQGISTESEAGVQDVRNLADWIVKHRVPAVFIESSIPKRNIEAVQQAVRSRGWNVRIGGELYSDALGPADTSAGTYQGMIRHNVSTIVNALKTQK